MAPRYQPPTRVTTVQMPYLSLVTAADPDWSRRKFWDVEYEMSNKPLYANPYTRGAYNDFSNVYPVGQPYGGLDAVKIAAKAPTAGVPTPGLFVGTPDGKGWA
jgi:hypothetical protein